MMRPHLAAATFSALALLGAFSAAAHADAAAECDRLAGLEQAPWEGLDAAAAVEACGRAVEAQPDAVQLRFQYARSLTKAGEYDQAMAYFGELAAQGHGPSQYSIGWIYGNVEDDPWQAAAWYRLAADNGYPKAQYMLGRALWEGQGVVRDREAAVSWFRQSAEQGFSQAQHLMGLLHEQGQAVEEDMAAAAAWYRRAAEGGLAAAQMKLERLYAEGRGVPRDATEAAAWLRRAAEQGLPRAQYELGRRYLQGAGVGRDDARAARWLEAAAEQGHGRAQYLLGTLYEAGRGGLEADPEKAVAWWRRAAESSPEAQLALGRLYEAGRGVPRSDAKAVAWYLKAAARGEAEAQLAAAEMLASGRGVAADPVRAVLYYSDAARQGLEPAQAVLEEWGVAKLALPDRVRAILGARAASWHLAPLVPGPWYNLAGAELEDSVGLLREALTEAGIPLRPVAQARALALPFYPGATLYEYEGMAGEGDDRPMGVYALVHHPRGTTLITGSAAPVHELNRSIEPRLDHPAQVAAYLQFFNRAVDGDAGLFQFVDEADDLHWVEAATAEERALAARLVKPVSLRRLDDGSWRAVTTIGYSHSLFETVYAVEPDGEVTMLRDFPVNAYMPVAAERYQDGLRVLEAESPGAHEGPALGRRFDTLTDVLMVAAQRDDAVVAERALRAALAVYEANEVDLGWNLEKIGALYGLRAWYELMDGRVGAAIEAGERALVLNNAYPLSKTNLAHALLLDGQRERAERLYREVAEARSADPQRFLKVLREDFQALGEAGLDSPHMDGVLAMLSAGLQPEEGEQDPAAADTSTGE